VNKKKQKNFNNFWPVALERPWRRGAKVFWFFFSKKNSLFLLTFLIFWTAWELHKKKQKNFDFFAVTTADAPQVLRGAKVFLVLFRKTKEHLP
jgi:hypothetical protein